MTETMHAVHLTGHGGFDCLQYRTDVPVPTPGDGEVLVQIAAAGINNTDINTRIGWYSKAVTSDTNAGGDGFEAPVSEDGGWAGALSFPRIQGADGCGKIVAVGVGVPESRIGERVLIRALQAGLDNSDQRRTDCITFGSETDGCFAQFTAVRANEVFKVDSNWSDVELASIPCAYSTAEGMLHKVGLGAEKVFITGASGGVGSAAVQLAKRRGAEVIAQCAASKHDVVKSLGADHCIDRGDDIKSAAGLDSCDVALDLVAGPQWPDLLEILRSGGRYVTAGAIAGPMVELDVRTLYLKDLTLLGSTRQPVEVFKNLISYIEKNEINPVVSKTYPLEEIVQAQQDFLDKGFVGKLVLVPPQV